MNRDKKQRVPARTIAGIASAVVGMTALTAGSAMAQTSYDEPDTSTPTPEESIDLAQLAAMAGRGGGAPSGRSDDGLRSWKDVSQGFEKVVSTADGRSFYNLYINKKENKILAELPRGYDKQNHFFAMTVAGGEIFAGLQSGDLYTKWKRIGNRLALIQPQIAVRSTGDQESKDSLETVFTDRVLLDVPILATGPSGQPVIDLNGLLVNQATSFFGGSARGLNPNLTTVASVKAFPQNVEIRYEGPVAGGTIKEFHYSISLITGSRGFKPRQADQRLGYFVTTYTDLGKYDSDEKAQRYINRWHIEKADPRLSLSPPKEPIVYYVEHTVPIRYRRWVREGIEQWNDAFRAIGIDGAIQVQYQDKATGTNMDKDPEDVRYNFIRWISNDVSTAIGPSRVNPMTGEILDADVVLTDGWVRVFTYRWEDLLGTLATEGYSPATLQWLEENPEWDPRLRLATPQQRDIILNERSNRSACGHDHSSHLNQLHQMDGFVPGADMLGNDEFDGLGGRASQVNGMCMAATGKALDLAMMRMYLSMIDLFAADLQEVSATAAANAETGAAMEPEIDEETLEMIRKQLEENPGLKAMIPPEYLALLEKKDEPKEEEPESEDEAEGEEAPEAPKADKKDEGDMIDGVPEWFVGPMLAELVAHEVGHTLGLRHNFKGSSAYSLSEINSEAMKDQKPWSASVMDYNGINIMMPGFGEVQGNHSSFEIGPYDYWVIEYGYGPEKNLPKVLERVSEPELQYGTDEDTFGPDPRARRYDLAENPLDFANNQMSLVKTIREGLLTKFVDDGDSWSRARRGYLISLNTQMQSLSMMANWVGSAYVYRDKKGDPGSRAPIEVVPAERQRAAMQFVIDNSFYDEAFGISPELLTHTTVDKWWDDVTSVMSDAALPIHDRIMGMQASALTMLLNPQTVQRVYDYELFVPADQDALTLAELMQSVTEAAWKELGEDIGGGYDNRNPMISSLRRNLQREHLDRLIDMAFADGGFNSSAKPVKMLSMMHLRKIKDGVDGVLENRDALDAYTRAHLEEVSQRVGKALDAGYVYTDN
ncbi:MAG: zinc-dependent metalloprotease [Phycisphaerales bacterium]|nr:zinc-dependent metalloprotease [Phycisphaerales bacterium]